MNVKAAVLAVLQAHNETQASYPGGPSGFCSCGAQVNRGIRSHQADKIAELFDAGV